MAVEWAGDSTAEELIPGMGNMSAFSWLSQRHARRGIAARIQVGVYFWLALRRIRIPPFYLRSPRNISSGCLTRTTETEISQRDNTHFGETCSAGFSMGRIRKVNHVFTPIPQYPTVMPRALSQFNGFESYLR